MSYGEVSLGNVGNIMGQAGIKAEAAAGVQGTVAETMQIAGTAIIEITDRASDALGSASLLQQRLDEAMKQQGKVHKAAHTAAKLGAGAVHNSVDEDARKPVAGLAREDEETELHRERIKSLWGIMDGVVKGLGGLVKVLEEEAVPLVTGVMEGTDRSKTNEAGYAKEVNDKARTL